MKNAHIVFAHPNLNSFNGQLKNSATKTLKDLGWNVSNSDLYQMNFNAIAGVDDFENLNRPDYFDIQIEQSLALQNDTFSNDIKREHQLLEQSDLVIFQFPLWWYSMPAILKGYFDRVFSVGWAYGNGNALKGKKALLSVTTGAPAFLWTKDQKGDLDSILKHISIGTLEFCGLINQKSFISYGVKRLSELEKTNLLQDYSKYIQTILKE